MSGPALHTRIWLEEAQPDDAFATRAAYCHGFDVYGQMLGRASWIEMLYLLIKGEAPAAKTARTLETLAVALANPGPRDPMVHAAMCGGIGGTPAAASLMAALAVGAGQSGGARDVYLAMQHWHQCRGLANAEVITLLTQAMPPAWLSSRDFGWPAIEHPAGFAPNGASTAGIVLQTLLALNEQEAGPCIAWLHQHRAALEQAATLPLAMTGVAAAALTDLGFSAAQGEMLFLLLRLPGAAAHALEQGDNGFKQFPFPPIQLEDDPYQKEHAA
jgi:citrate synthase